MPEIWKPVVGHEGSYEVSSHGRVRSLDRIDAAGRQWPGRAMKFQAHQLTGHLELNLTNNGVHHKRKVHHLVLEAFVGQMPDGMVCCHGDGNPQNNMVENLRWDTPKANSQDMIRHGRSKRSACRRGHPFIEANRVVYGGVMRCKACARAREKARSVGLELTQELADETFRAIAA